VIAGLIAAIVYWGSVRLSWAFDDGPIIESNPAAHSPAAALDAFFSPYWPGDRTTSGQYRPLTILSFAVDWTVSSGNPAWFHVVNAVLHGLVTALITAVALAWLAPFGALVAGTIFAVHPVHVEAVANVVGRGELLAAAGILGCMLCARRYRRAEAGRQRGMWLTFAGLSLLGALLAKEHAVVTIAAVALDQYLDPKSRGARSLGLYVVLLAITGAWLYLWHSIAGQFVAVSEAATIRDLTTFQRLATMFPAQLDVVRLLLFPLDLAADYNPQLIARRVDWSAVATLGMIVTLAILALGLLSVRRAPAVCFGIVFGSLTYAPTANLLFASGIILAERNLYLAASAAALVWGWIAAEALTTWRSREARPTAMRPGLVGMFMTLTIAFYVARTVTRIPFWKDGNNVLLMDYAEHSENYRARLRLGGYLRSVGDLPGALAEATTAGAIFPADPWVAQYSVVRALDLGLPGIALREARRSYTIDPNHPSFARLVVRSWLALGQFDSAMVIARQSVDAAPESPIAAYSYMQVLDSLGVSGWQRSLAEARHHWVEDRLGSASHALDVALTGLPERLSNEAECWEVQASLPIVHALRRKLERLNDLLARSIAPCQSGIDGSSGNDSA